MPYTAFYPHRLIHTQFFHIDVYLPLRTLSFLLRSHIYMQVTSQSHRGSHTTPLRTALRPLAERCTASRQVRTLPYSQSLMLARQSLQSSWRHYRNLTSTQITFERYFVIPHQSHHIERLGRPAIALGVYSCAVSSLFLRQKVSLESRFTSSTFRRAPAATTTPHYRPQHQHPARAFWIRYIVYVARPLREATFGGCAK